MIPNTALRLKDLPVAPVGVDDLFGVAGTFFGYAIWGGFHPCALVANEVAEGWGERKRLPESLTLLRTALFFESRREKFVDYGGFGDDPDGYEEHHASMRILLEAIREALVREARDDEDKAVAKWLATHDPSWPEPEPPEMWDDGWPSIAADVVDDGRVAAATALAARLVGTDIAEGRKIDEDRMRERLCLAIRHLAPVDADKERSVPIHGFRGAGPVDIVLRDRATAEPVGLIEVKWSVDVSRGKIYEAAWDAIKLVLAEAPRAVQTRPQWWHDRRR